LPSKSAEDALPRPTTLILVSPSGSPLPVNGGRFDERTSTGLEPGVIIGPLFAILAVCALIFLLVFWKRRRSDRSMAMSQDGNELTFETEVSETMDGSITFEDEMSGAGSQYANMSDFEAMADDVIADFNDGQGLEETLFGF
jgi:hypothetical protein